MSLTEERRAYARDYKRRRYADDPEFRTRCLAISRAHYAANKKSMIARARAWQAAHPKMVRAANRRRLGFLGRMITLAANPREGWCRDCGADGVRTHMHHERYDINNPLAYTVELCIRCHNLRHSNGEAR